MSFSELLKNEKAPIIRENLLYTLERKGYSKNLDRNFRILSSRQELAHIICGLFFLIGIIAAWTIPGVSQIAIPVTISLTSFVICVVALAVSEWFSHKLHQYMDQELNQSEVSSILEAFKNKLDSDLNSLQTSSLSSSEQAIRQEPLIGLIMDIEKAMEQKEKNT